MIFINKIKDIVRKARGEMSQADFSKKIGKSQGLLSKYERGTANPPAETIEKCMKILETREKQNISSDALAKRIQAELKPSKYLHARQTIAAILDGIQNS